MSIYHKYLSRFSIFFSVLFVVFLLFIESNIGFQWIFNLTSRFFLGIKIEEISGNWRDFTLKNIHYNTLNTSIAANRIHVVLDFKSLFQISTIIKNIETEKLIISFKKNTNNSVLKEQSSNNFFGQYKFIKNSLLFEKIHVNNMVVKTPNTNIILSNILTSIDFSNNNITVFPTYIDNIQIALSKQNLEKKLKKNNSIAIKSLFKNKKVYNFLSMFSTQKKNFIPINFDLIFLKCKKASVINYHNINFFDIKLSVQFKKNILKIKKIKANSSFLKLQSYGKIIFHNNRCFSSIIHNKVSIPRFHNKFLNISLKFNLDEKLKFKLQCKNLYKFNITGTVFLNNFIHSFYLNLKSKYLFFSVKKNLILEIKNLNAILQGNLRHYSLLLENVVDIQDISPVLIKIKAKGSLKNIFLKKIEFFPVEEKILQKKVDNSKDKITNNQYLLKLMGKMNVIGTSNNNKYDMHFSKIHFNGNIIKKNLSILGSLNYKNFNFLDVPGIEFRLGQNKLYLEGTIGKKFNVNSSIYANNLDYFLPNLKGKIKSISNICGDYMFPIMITSKTYMKNISINDIFLNSLKIFTNINVKNQYSGTISLNAKNISFSNFYINSLLFKTHWYNDDKKKFFFLLKNNELYINLMIKTFYDYKTKTWHGFFKKANIKTFLGNILIKDSVSLHFHSVKNLKNNDYQKIFQKKNEFLSFVYNTNEYLSSIFHQYFKNFQTKFSTYAKLKWIFNKNITDGKLLLSAHDVQLIKTVQKNSFFNNIDRIRLSLHLKKNKLKSQWILNQLPSSTKKTNISGYLNIIDIYNKKNIEGKCVISNTPISIVNFFSEYFKKIKGEFTSNIVFFGNFFQPKISANVEIQDIFIKDNNILKYMTSFLPYFFKKMNLIKINKSILIKKADILFTFNTNLKQKNSTEWNLSFKSEKIAIAIFPKIKVKFASFLNLHCLFSIYDLTGYIKFALLHFIINEKNFLFNFPMINE